MSNLGSRLRRLEEALPRVNDCPALVFEYGNDDYKILKPDHPLHGQHISKAECDEFISSLPEGQYILFDFNPDSREHLETIGQMLERLGPDWLEKYEEERRRGIVRVWYTDDEIIFEYNDGRKESAGKDNT